MKSFQALIATVALAVATTSVFAADVTVPSVSALGSLSLGGSGSFASVNGTGSSYQGSANETRGLSSIDFSTVGNKTTLETFSGTTSLSGAEGIVTGNGAGGAIAGGASISGALAIAPIVGFSLPAVANNNGNGNNGNGNNGNHGNSGD